MKRFVAEGVAFPWRRQGRVFAPGGGEWSHASHPCAVQLEGDRFVVAFTRRDRRQRSHIFLSYARVADGRLTLEGEAKMALRYGDPGCFDCDGAISVCFVKHQECIYLYYVGWQNLPDSLWICDTGRAILDPARLELRREFQGPVLARDRNNPLFAAATAFHVSGGKWRTWYNSGIRWERTDHGWKHYYGIHYAESDDGVDWVTYPGLCIPFADQYEYAFGRPTVYRHDDTYYMWFAHRATRDISTYRIGFASSQDGRSWVRNDGIAGIDVSADGWDSEMVCYPSVFEHHGSLYMLYNGNGYGETGFGLAVLERD